MPDQKFRTVTCPRHSNLGGDELAREIYDQIRRNYGHIDGDNVLVVPNSAEGDLLVMAFELAQRVKAWIL